MESQKVINLTEHVVRVYKTQNVDDLIAAYPPVAKGDEARVVTTATPTQPVRDGEQFIPVVVREFGEVKGLPAPAPNTVYLVSSIVLAQVKHRTDVFAPDTGPDSGVRGTRGNIVGVTRFTRDQ